MAFMVFMINKYFGTSDPGAELREASERQHTRSNTVKIV
jgi:hypothetical protein